MDLSHNPRHLEVGHLSLSAKQFPLEVTLRPRVVEHFADDSTDQPDSETLSTDQLLGRLRQWQDLSDCPLDSVLAQGQACSDFTAPSREQAALLRWLAAAYALWEQDFPLESQLSERLRHLKPLVAALAVTDPVFLVPGRHPLHKLLDSVQAAAIGWQASLGRAAQAMEKQIDTLVEKALEWFERRDTDLGAIVNELERQLARDGERAQKMARRVVEVELGRQKKAEAAATAAGMINAALEKYPVPEEIGELIKGYWYDSAQLALLKFGAGSEEWGHVCKATDTLLDSVQVLETEPQERRQHLFRVVTVLPKELKRWLFSLHHDNTALNDAVAVVEFAHLCILRNKPLETRIVDPLPLPGGAEQEGEEQLEPEAVEVGQWYLIRQEGQPPLRARIIFKLQQERRLLFANRAGMEALRLDYDDFSALLARGDATLLRRGASFSRCLAAAAGVTGESDLEALPRADAGDTAGLSGPAETDEETVELTKEEEEQARLWREWKEARARQLAHTPDTGHDNQTGENS